MTQKTFVEKHVQLHKQTVKKFDLNIWVNPGLTLPAFEQPAPVEKAFPGKSAKGRHLSFNYTVKQTMTMPMIFTPVIGVKSKWENKFSI